MSIITCKKCGSKVSDQYSYCTNCQAPIKAKTKASATQVSDTKPPAHSGFMRWLTSPLEAKRGPKHKLPSDTRQGALVGAFVGLLSGIYTAAIAYFVMLPIIWPTLTASLAESPKALVTLPTLRNILVGTVVVGVPIISVSMGALLGVLFIVFRKKLPGSTILRKSVAFSYILLVIDFLYIGLRHYVGSSRITAFDKATLATLNWMQVAGYAITLVEFPLLGCLFGYLLDRKLKPK